MRFIFQSSSIIFLLLLFNSISLADSQQPAEKPIASVSYTIQSVPNPKENPSWNYVSNPDGVLSEGAVTQINYLLQSLEDSATVQAAVVVLQSIGDEVPHDFGVELFNYWGIGQKEKDNGLLILLVLDQRAIEFVTGKGTEGVLTDVVCKNISEKLMVPAARENDFDRAVLNGIIQVNSVFLQPENVTYLYETPADSFSASPNADDYSAPVTLLIFALINSIVTLVNSKAVFKSATADYVKTQDKSYYYLKTALLNIGLMVAFVVYQFVMGAFSWWVNGLFLYVWFILVNFEKRLRLNSLIAKKFEGDENKRLTYYHALKKSNYGWPLFSIPAPVPFLFYSGWLKQKLSSIRDAPLTCDRCGHSMNKTSEEEDDQYLKPDETLEEKIKSADYDVWKCPHCADLQKFFFDGSSTKYSHCPQCKAKTFYESSRKTVVSPTYVSGGEGLALSECLNCRFKSSKKYSIAKLVRSSSSSGSGGSFSSSSSGGSSFGGGSSGGGGSSSKW
jgi:uncharacterized protein